MRLKKYFIFIKMPQTVSAGDVMIIKKNNGVKYISFIPVSELKTLLNNL